ncbi:hypothetical protein Bbelb_065110 [Branchiostoma belcheri]|nr:hypothetical protein Bbelb_065110 [Branchiostoma belcheri]
MKTSTSVPVTTAAVNTAVKIHLAVTPVRVGLGTSCQDQFIVPGSYVVSRYNSLTTCATYDARNRSRPDLACKPHSYTLRNHSPYGGGTHHARMPCVARVLARGQHAEAHVDECSSSPCHNGGICRNLINGYSCDCPSGWTGDNCQSDVDECSSSPCHNGGICRNLINGYSCDCPSGWTGDNCQSG